MNLAKQLRSTDERAEESNPGSHNFTVKSCQCAVFKVACRHALPLAGKPKELAAEANEIVAQQLALFLVPMSW